MLKAAAESSVALKAEPYESDSVHCPFYMRHGIPIFKYYSKYPENAGRFAKAMAGWRKSKRVTIFTLVLIDLSPLTKSNEVENSVTELRDNFPWADLKGTVVDIGGGSGHVAIILARVSI